MTKHAFRIEKTIFDSIGATILENEFFNKFRAGSLLRCGSFFYDLENYQTINKLISYFSGSEKFEKLPSKSQVLSLKKGVFLVGNTGSGKTELMRIFQGLVRNLETAYSFNSAISYTNIEFSALQRKNILIDDFGKEDVKNEYGVKIEVLSDLIFKRYDAFKSFGSLTHFTTQLTEEDIAARYGAHILGRIKEMCNIFPLGTSETAIDRRNSAIPFQPMPVHTKEFPMFFPNYKTIEAEEMEKRTLEVLENYKIEKELAELRRISEVEMSEEDRRAGRIGQLMGNFLGNTKRITA